MALPTDSGSMQSSDKGPNYVGSAHWAAVLGGIAELKDHLDDERALQSHPANDDSCCTSMTGPQLLFGCPELATKAEILASLPARSVVDRLVSRYFNSFEMSPGDEPCVYRSYAHANDLSLAVLHSGQFLREVRKAYATDAIGTVTDQYESSMKNFGKSLQQHRSAGWAFYLLSYAWQRNSRRSGRIPVRKLYRLRL